jgi:polyphosphate kinase
MCLVVRREGEGITRYVHLATGNYNDVTARIYTDMGFFTCDPELGVDVSDLFNALTGYSRKQEYRKLLVAPGLMQKQFVERIDREIERHLEHGDGHIVFKMNSLVDKACIKALYRASQAGVKVDLQVRGICCLRPGVPGVSENITVTSIVGRFLEHTRIYYFRNGGDEEILLGSADLMPRNLYRRVESLFPIEDPEMLSAVRDRILNVHLQDNMQSRRLLSDGSYEWIEPDSDDEPLNSQLWMIENRGVWHRHDGDR